MLREFVFSWVPPFDGEVKHPFENERLKMTAEEAALREAERYMARGMSKKEAYRKAGLSEPDDASGGAAPAARPSSFKP